MEVDIELRQEDWRCPVCLDLLYKPCINSCGHIMCFWCMHHAMDPYQASQCPLCRSAYVHFPKVCTRLHAMLAHALPEAYKQRELETKEEEERRGVRSVVVSSRVEGGTDAPPSPAAAPSARRASSPPQRPRVRSLLQQLLRCDRPSCGRLLHKPLALSCGHLVCGSSCAAGGKAGSGGAGAVCAEPAAAACPACGAGVASSPAVCGKVDDLLRQAFPDEQAARSNVAHGVAEGSGPSSEAAAAAVAAAASGAARRPLHHGRQQPLPGAAELLSSGAPVAQVWSALQRSLREHADTSYTWMGVGCDECGMYPIVGSRFTCEDCQRISGPIGYDLCGACHKRLLQGQAAAAGEPGSGAGADGSIGGAAASGGGGSGGGVAGVVQPVAEQHVGRFNQIHTAQHVVVKAAPVLAVSLDTMSQHNAAAIINLLQVVHPELSVYQILQLLTLQLPSLGDADDTMDAAAGDDGDGSDSNSGAGSGADAGAGAAADSGAAWAGVAPGSSAGA